MALANPKRVYTAASNEDAVAVRIMLDSEGIESHVSEDVSFASVSIAGRVGQLHKAVIHVDESDFHRATQLILKHDEKRTLRAKQRSGEDTVEGTCDDCGQTSHYDANHNGTIQACKQCGSYLDVGETEWDDIDVGEPE